MRKGPLLSVVVLVLALGIYSCKKGDTGPAGPKGAPGSANVKYSAWTTLRMTFEPNDSLYEQTLRADSLTQAILDSGVVLTYIKDPQAGIVVNASNYLSELFSVGAIDLFALGDFSGLQYRYVIIPGGVKIGRLASGSSYPFTKEEWEALSYEQVMKLLGKEL